MKIKNCPFCGSKPDFPEAKDVFGTCYDFGCEQCGMAWSSIQIVDCFDRPREHLLDSWDKEKHQYGIQYIEVVRNKAIEMWNQRV